jgi:hypothetical protein
LLPRAGRGDADFGVVLPADQAERPFGPVPLLVMMTSPGLLPLSVNLSSQQPILVDFLVE